jgi:hypothetical protein
VVYICYTCGLKATKQQNKRKKNISQLCQQHGTKLLAKRGLFPSKPCQLCQQGSFANSFVHCSPVGEGNDSRADGVLLSPTEHVVVDEAFPTGPALLLAKSSFPSLKTQTVLSQQERANPVGKSFVNRIGVFANSLALLPKRPFPVVN